MKFNIEICRQCPQFSKTWQLVAETFALHCMIPIPGSEIFGHGSILRRIGAETKDGTFYKTWQNAEGVPKDCPFTLEHLLLESQSNGNKALDESPE